MGSKLWAQVTWSRIVAGGIQGVRLFQDAYGRHHGQVFGFIKQEGGTRRRTSSKGDDSAQPFTYQFIIMKISIKITNIQIITPMVSTKTKTASVSGRLDLFICNSREKTHTWWLLLLEKKRDISAWKLYLKNNSKKTQRISGKKVISKLACDLWNVLFKHAEKSEEFNSEHPVFPPARYYHQHFTIHFSILLQIHWSILFFQCIST